MSEPYSLEKAQKALQDFYLKNCPTQYIVEPPQDYLDYYKGTIYTYWEINSGVKITLRWGLEEEPTLSWPSTHYDLVSAGACLGLYKTILDFALALEVKRQEELRYVERSNKKNL